MSNTKPLIPLELLSIFYGATDFPCVLAAVQSDHMPTTYQQLLNHENHMTVTVETFHDSLVDVKVLEVDSNEEFYARKILLTRQSDEKVVQFGIVRLNRRLIPAAALAEIESQRTPLGRVLIEQDVMRQVQLDELWHIQPFAELREHFDSSSTTYGRTARLIVNEESAVELLEIVAPVNE